MFLSPLSLVFVHVCMLWFHVHPPPTPTPPLKSMHIYFIPKCFRLISSNVHPLNLTEQMFQSRLRLDWFHSSSSLWRRNASRKDIASFSLWVALKTGTWKKYTKTEGSWQCFVGAWNDKLKRKASMPGGSGENAKLRIIREEIYCTYLKAVATCNTVLIKGVNHFLQLWLVVWLAPPVYENKW